MVRWQVVLTGHDFDLEYLPRLFTAPECRVIEQDGKYLLEAEQFKALTDGVAVHAAALNLLPHINGVAKLKYQSFRNVDVGPVREFDEEGKTRQHHFVSAVRLEARAKVRATGFATHVEEPAPPAPGSLDSDEWMRVAGSNAYASRALALWGGPHDPPNLWKVWELLRDYSGVTIDPDLKRRFLPSLNDKTIAGGQARHEVRMTLHPVEPDTMEMSEAEAFIGHLLSRWLG